MNKSIYILLIFISINLHFSCKRNIEQNTNKESTTEKSFIQKQIDFPLSKPLVSGHRGAIGYTNYPENCLETFEYLRSQFFCILECDIAKTKDGKLILMHDNSLDRTTNGTGKVVDRDFDYIKNLLLKDDDNKLTDYHVPTFKSILEWAKKTQTVLSIDIKRSITHNEVIEFIRDHGARENCIVISYSLQQAMDNYRLDKKIMHSVSIRNMKEYDHWAEKRLPVPSKIMAFTGTRRSEKILYETLKKEGIVSIFGTFGNIDNQAKARGSKIYHQLIESGVDIIATNTPIEAQKAIDEKW